MLYYPMPAMFQWRQFWRLMRFLIISWTIWPVMMMVILAINFATSFSHGHPLILLTKSVIKTGWAYQETAQPGVYITQACQSSITPSPLAPSGSFKTAQTTDSPTPQLDIPLASSVPFHCHDERVTAAKLAVKVGQLLMVPYLFLGVFGSLVSLMLYGFDLLDNMETRRRVRKLNKTDPDSRDDGVPA